MERFRGLCARFIGSQHRESDLCIVHAAAGLEWQAFE